jgi:hypothetical protein
MIDIDKNPLMDLIIRIDRSVYPVQSRIICPENRTVISENPAGIRADITGIPDLLMGRDWGLHYPLGIHPGRQTEQQDKNTSEKSDRGILMVLLHNSKISSIKGRDNLYLSKAVKPEIKTQSCRSYPKTN